MSATNTTEEDWGALDTTCIALCTMVIVVHSIAIYLFYKDVNTNTIIRDNNIEIISLSTSTIALAIAYNNYVIVKTSRPVWNKYTVVPVYMISMPFYGSLIMLTIQRFFALYYHLRYQSSGIYNKRRYFLAAFYVGGLVVGALDLGLLQLEGGETLALFVEKSVIILAVFLTNVIFIVVYIYIFIKYKRASQQEKTSFYKPKRRSLLTPVIIYISLLLFGTIPYMFHDLLTKSIQYVVIWFCLDSFSNAVVYLVLNPTLRQGLCKKRHATVQNSISLKGSSSEPTSRENVAGQQCI